MLGWKVKNSVPVLLSDKQSLTIQGPVRRHPGLFAEVCQTNFCLFGIFDIALTLA